MKILLVNDYGSLDGGAEVIVFSLRDALRARGHDVRVFTSSARSEGVPISADSTGFGTKGRWRAVVQSCNVAAARSLRRTITEFRPDLVHVNLYLTQLSPLIVRAIGDVPAVYYAQWYRAICPVGTRWLPGGGDCSATVGAACLTNGCVRPWDWPPLMAQMALNRAWGGRFDRVTAISQAVATRLTQFGPPFLRSPQIVHPGTTVVAPRTELSADPTVIAAGRLVPEKGIDVLLQAFARLGAKHPSTRLVVVGEGPCRAELERLAVDLGLRSQVEFTGHLPHAETLQRMRSAWVVCVPSVWQEPFGMIAAEAQMHGVAVVASHTGGLAEIVKDGATGYLAPPGDVESLAARLDLLCGDRDAAARLGAHGHERAREQFSLDAFATRFEHVYRDAVASHGARP